MATTMTTGSLLNELIKREGVDGVMELLSQMKSSLTESITVRVPTMTKATKKITPYNVFMKTKIAEVKAAYPTMIYAEVFKKAASMWKTAPENPKAIEEDVFVDAKDVY
jgi:hypothetical protein